MDCIVHRVTQSWTQFSDFYFPSSVTNSVMQKIPCLGNAQLIINNQLLYSKRRKEGCHCTSLKTSNLTFSVSFISFLPLEGNVNIFFFLPITRGNLPEEKALPPYSWSLFLLENFQHESLFILYPARFLEHKLAS